MNDGDDRIWESFAQRLSQFDAQLPGPPDRSPVAARRILGKDAGGRARRTGSLASAVAVVLVVALGAFVVLGVPSPSPPPVAAPLSAGLPSERLASPTSAQGTAPATSIPGGATPRSHAPCDPVRLPRVTIERASSHATWLRQPGPGDGTDGADRLDLAEWPAGYTFRESPRFTVLDTAGRVVVDDGQRFRDVDACLLSNGHLALAQLPPPEQGSVGPSASPGGCGTLIVDRFLPAIEDVTRTSTVIAVGRVTEVGPSRMPARSDPWSVFTPATVAVDQVISGPPGGALHVEVPGGTIGCYSYALGPPDARVGDRYVWFGDLNPLGDVRVDEAWLIRGDGKVYVDRDGWLPLDNVLARIRVALRGSASPTPTVAPTPGS